MWNILNTEHKKTPGLHCESLTVTCLSLFSGNIIGSGIFISPKGVLEHSGSVGLALVVWVLGGGIAALGSLCYAELGVTIPKSGGDYSYVTEIFGGLMGYDKSIYNLLNSEWKSNVRHMLNVLCCSPGFCCCGVQYWSCIPPHWQSSLSLSLTTCFNQFSHTAFLHT